MKNTINKNKKNHSKQALNTLDLLLKEFELAYNLGPELNPKSIKKLKDHILRILNGSIEVGGHKVDQNQFSFKAESLLSFSNFLQES